MEPAPVQPDPLPDVDHVLGPRDVVSVDGADAERYLHSQVSQSVAGMAVGEQRWTFVLEPTGKVDSLARITRTGEQRFELDTDAGHGEALLARLNRFRIRVDATIELRPSELADDRAPDAEHERIRVGWPRLGSEIVPGETIPAGTGLTRLAVDFRKGCYPGQELVERMDSRAAEAPRSLRRLVVPEGAAAGDPVLDDGAEVGVLTSVHGTEALAWVKRSSDLGEVVQF
jgi:folate-binding protein YgfZ